MENKFKKLNESLEALTNAFKKSMDAFNELCSAYNEYIKQLNVAFSDTSKDVIEKVKGENK